MGIEFRRIYPLLECRATSAGADAAGVLEGYAAVFDTWAEIWVGFREKIRRGAFAKTIRERDQVALWQHDTRYPMGRKSMGTLDLREDERGLWFRMTLGNQSWARDAYESVVRGDVQGMSFAFEQVKEQVERGPNGEVDRELVEVKLFEVSLVTEPAYAETSVEARARELVAARYLGKADGRSGQSGVWGEGVGGAGAETTEEPGPGSHSAAGDAEAGSDGWRVGCARRRREMELMGMVG